MSKFEKNLIKYLSYGFFVGIYYSFITNNNEFFNQRYV